MPRTIPVTLALALLAVPSPAPAGTFDADETSGQQLIDYLDHPDWRYRHDACEEIAERKLTQAEDRVVLLALEDASERVRRRCLEALKATASGKLLPAAEMMVLEDVDADNRRYALGLVEDIGNERSAPVLAQVVLGDADPGVRRKAVAVVRKRAWKEAAAAVRAAARDDSDRGVRDEARDVLIHWGDAESRAVLHQILADEPDAGIRRQIVEMFEERPQQGDLDALLVALDDPDAHVARHAARALVRLGDRAAGPILRKKALEATDAKVAEEFNEAAGKLGG